MRRIELWRDKDQTRHGGRPIIWVVLCEDNLVKETLNEDDPHTDLGEAWLFARYEATRLGTTVVDQVKDV